MSWQDRGTYEGHSIHVIQLREGKWNASVAALPQSGGAFATPGPGDECVPGDFDSDDEAVKGAKRYIDQKQQQRGT
jgi:hypothetical protein